ncbi:MAG: Ig-like domain-containing protein, partial [Arcobacteraceae bacterium]|nr:Ig-like domain-containing protein [Arcobacteraceae bacterium]
SGSDLKADSDKTIDVSVKATDNALNQGTISAIKTYSVDTTVPGDSDGDGVSDTAPILTISEANDGYVNSDELLDGVQTTVTIPTGVEAGDKVVFTILNPDNTTTTYEYSVTSDDVDNNIASITVPKDLFSNDGSYGVSVVITDESGNTTPSSSTVNFIVDVSSPDNTTTTITIDDITSDNTINSSESLGNVEVTGTVSGTYTTGDEVTLLVNNTAYVTYVDSNGNFSVNVSGSDLKADSDKTIDVSVKATDNALNQGTISAIKTYSVDTTVPESPLITNIIDTNGDYSNIIMHGTGEAGATITLYSQQGSTTAGNNTGSNIYIAIATVIVASNGLWSIDISNLPDTPINDNEFFYVTQTNTAGNVSESSDLVHYWHGDWAASKAEVNDDYVFTGSGNDTITINVDDTNDYYVVDGGNGNDSVIFTGNASEYTISTNTNGNTIITETNGSDSNGDGIGDVTELRNIEIIKFADGIYDIGKGTFIPTINIDDTTIIEDTAQIIAHANDIDGTVSIASSSASHGTLSMDSSGNIIYTPDSNYSGSDNITITIVDDKGATVTQTMNLTINAVADSPMVDISVQAIGSSVITGDNLIVNGSFEDLSGTDANGNSVNNADIISSGLVSMTTITGWHLITNAGSNAPVMEIHHKEHASVGATNGDNYIDLGETHNTCDHDNDNTQIAQTISGLANGTTYLLSFDYFDKAFLQETGLSGQNSGKLAVYWGGELIATIDDNNTIWKTKNLELIGGSGDGSNLLSFKEIGEGGDNWGIAIDNVTLVEKQLMFEYNVNINASLTDNDGSEVLSVLISGVPSGATLTSSLYTITNNNNGTWSIEIPQGTKSIADNSIILIIPNSVSQDFTITATATAVEVSNSDTVSTSDSATSSGTITTPSVDPDENYSFRDMNKNGYASLNDYVSDTLITGSGNDTITFTDDIKNHSYISTGAGNDELIGTSTSSCDSEIKGYSTVDMGSGNDIVKLEDIREGSTLILGEGDDKVNADQLEEGSTINAGDGNDTVVLNTIEESSILDMGAGDDTASVGYIQNSTTIDMGTGNDVFKLLSGQNINFGTLGNVLKNMEEIDLSADGKNELKNITLQDVIDMTDDKNEIKITGTDEDKVTLSNEWKLNSTLSDTEFNVYSNDDETVKLKIQTDITDITIA